MSEGTCRTIYFARAGESTNSRLFKVDADISEEGELYAQRLKKIVLAYCEKRKAGGTPEEKERPSTVWTSTRKKAKQTALAFTEAGIPVRQHSVLNQLNPGEVDGLTSEEINPSFLMKLREQKKIHIDRHRYPRAESYHDLAVRLESVIMELEREKNDILIIAHDSILRCLYAYLFDRPDSEIPTIPMPRPGLIEIMPSAYGCKESRIKN